MIHFHIDSQGKACGCIEEEHDDRPRVKEIETKQDAEAFRVQIEEFAADLWAFDPDTRRTDWEEWAERFESYTGIELPGQWDDPAMLKVKDIARAVIREVA